MEEQGRGFITVNVRTAGGALPVEGAMITVKSVAGPDSTVVAVMYTDEGGASELLALPAPPRRNSLSPEPDGEAFSLYSLDTDRSGFYTVVNSNVPIYDGITSVQQVLLVPIAEGSGRLYPYDLTRYSDTGETPGT